MKKFKYDLTIALIVKNEEKVLERCLKSIQPLKEKINLQLIITDTGSTDKTKEIAKKYADLVLDFEWCNDFSKARNTGVKKALGKWFMFIDADEYFDETVLELAKFVQDKNNDKYDNATINLKDYSSNFKLGYRQYTLMRLFNFSNEVREFIYAIHENIPSVNNTFNIDTILHHDGYLNEKILLKKDRNDAFLRKLVKEDPKDLRSLLYIYNASDDLNESIDTINELIDNARKYNITNNSYYEIALNEKLVTLNKMSKFSETVIFAKKYLELVNKKSAIHLEMLYQYIVALDKTNDLKTLNEIIKQYQKTYEYLKKKPDNYIYLIQPKVVNHDLEYKKSFIIYANNLRKMGDLKNIDSHLKTELALFNEKNSSEYPLMNEYITLLYELRKFDKMKDIYLEIYKEEKAKIKFIIIIETLLQLIKFKTASLDLFKALAGDEDGYTALFEFRKNENISKKYEDLILSDSLLYKNSAFFEVFSCDIKNNTNKFKLIENYDAKYLLSIFINASNEDVNFKESVFKILETADIGSLKELVYYKNLVYAAIIKELANEDTELNIQLFDNYLELCMAYNNIVYKENLIVDDLININPNDAAAIVLYNSNRNNINFVSDLKYAITLDKNLAPITKILTENIEKELKKQNEIDDEFKELGKTIKMQVKTLVGQNMINEAKSILSQYEKINPKDSEIKELYKLFN